MRLRALLVQPVTLGLVLAVAAGVLLGEWFFAQAQDELLAERQEREVVMQTMALADLVAAVEKTAQAGASTLAALASEWAARHGEIAAIRVVRSGDARLLASDRKSVV